MTEELLCRESAQAMGRTWPNPSVACVIEAGGIVVSGGTEVPGRRHAEIAALDALDAKAAELGQNSRTLTGRMSVTLEPCSKFGRTPPCTDRIAQYPGLAVEFRTFDPSLSGEGKARLAASGLSAEQVPGASSVFVDGFVSRMQGKGPRYHIKIAHAAGVMGRRDGRMAISGASGMAFGQLLRARLDAVVAGPATVTTDMPRLDLRPFDPPEFHLKQGRDIFTESILASAGSVSNQAGSASEPARVFLVRPYPGAREFIELQREITDKSGRPALFISDGDWPDAVRCPPFRSAAFLPALREILASQGFNEVLFECGPGLARLLLPGLSVTDRMYFIESKAARTGDVLLGPVQEVTGTRSLLAEFESDTDVLRTFV